MQKLQDCYGWSKLSVTQTISVLFVCTGVHSKLSFRLNLYFVSEQTEGSKLEQIAGYPSPGAKYRVSELSV